MRCKNIILFLSTSYFYVIIGKIKSENLNSAWDLRSEPIFWWIDKIHNSNIFAKFR